MVITSIYLYIFATAFFLVSIPYVIKSGVAIMEYKRYGIKVLVKLLCGMGFQMLALSYINLAWHGLTPDHLLFPLQPLQTFARLKDVSNAILAYAFYISLVLAAFSLIVLLATFMKSKKKVHFKLAMTCSFIYLGLHFVYLSNDL